jgi:uncharacterized coiled-coil protein SlyX
MTTRANCAAGRARAPSGSPIKDRGRHVRVDDFDKAPAHLSPAAAQAYLDARIQGLCHDGALEVAEGVQRTLAAGSGRLDDVEFKIAHLERAVQELSDVLDRQQQQLDAAIAMNRELRGLLENLATRTDDVAPVEIPPHY